jgi:hypothetical protein
MKNMQFRKLAAVAGTAIMAGLTLAGPALAAGVTNVADIGMLAGASGTTAVFPTFVVGKDAQPADVAAAINLAAYLAGNVYQTQQISVTGGSATADGVVFRTELQNTTANTRDFSLSGTDISLQPTTRGGRPATFLKEGSFTLSGTQYKFYEKILMNRSSMPTTSGAFYLQRGSSDTTYENAYNNYGLAIPNDNLIYGLYFDTPTYVGANNLTAQTIKFLGQDYTVSSSTTSEIQLAPVGGSVGLKAGGTATVGAYTVTVDSIATASGGTADVFLTVCKGSVCSTSTPFKSGDTKTLNVGSDVVSVTLSGVAYGASAAVLVGTTSLDLKNGQTLDAYPNWRAGIGTTSNTVNNITLTYVQPHQSFTGAYPVLGMGQSVAVPMNFFELKNLGYESRSSYRLTASTGSNSNYDGGVASNIEGVTFALTDPTTGAAMKVWDVGGGTYSDKIAYDMTNGAWRYLNSSSGWSSASNTPKVQLTEAVMQMVLRNATDMVNAPIGGTSGADMVFLLQEPPLTAGGKTMAWYFVTDWNTGSNGYAQFNAPSGLVVGTSGNPDYLLYGKTTANDTSLYSVAYGGGSPKVRSAFASNYGASLVSASQTQVVIDIPKAENYVDVLLGREAGAGTSGSVVSKTPIQITSDVAKLDTEVNTAALTTDVVVMGGPAVNQLAATLLGKTYPAHGADSGIPQNAALVKVFQNAFGAGHVAVLIAGWDAPQTDLAVAAIQAGQVTNAVPAVSISGTVAAPTITAAS